MSRPEKSTPKKAKKPSPSSLTKESRTKKYRDDIKTEKQTKHQKSTRKITDLKNPTDVTIDSQKALVEMGLVSGTTNESFQSAKKKRVESSTEHQHAAARKLIAKRQNQTKNTLSLHGIHGKLSDFNQTDQVSESTLPLDLIDINLQYHKERNITQFPLEKLVSLGLLTAHVPSIQDKQASMSRQLGDDSHFMRKQLEHLTIIKHSSDDSVPVVKEVKSNNRSVSTMKKVVTPQGQTSATVKLSLVAGSMETVLGYKRNSSASQKNSTFEDFDRDKQERMNAFFRLDPLEDESPYGGIPTSYKMFHSLRAEMAEKYENRAETMKKQASMVPKTDIEIINRDYFIYYRRRPLPGEPTCINGTSCLFYTFSNDPEVRYIARPFQTPNEVRSGVKNPNGPCIDCFLCKLTLHVNEMKEKSINQSHPVNHFSVLVGVGQYSQKCMLDVSFNRHQTGIVGCVPRYSENYRDKGVLTLRDPVTNLLVQEKYICESNMDF